MIQLFIFIFASNPSAVSLQAHPQDTLCTSFQAKWRIQHFRLKFAKKIDISLEFQKTNLRVRISILEILCVCVCANFQAKQKALTSSDQISPKMDLGLEIHKTNVGIGIIILEILFQFSGKMNNFDFFSIILQAHKT